MKGIILAGGYATRLHPITHSLSKHLLPVYNKPMIYYPLSVLMLSDIREILIITSPEHHNLYHDLLGSGEQFGINFTYTVQDKPGGIAESLIIAEDFIGDDQVALVLGDNVLYGQGLPMLLEEARRALDDSGAVIFGYQVTDPQRYGVIELSESNNVLSLEEKPLKPKSDYAAIGLYFYNSDAVDIAKSLNPSSRGELEITDVNLHYQRENKLKAMRLGRGYAWLDMGTYDSLLEASEFIRILEHRQGIRISCPEEIAYRMNYIDRDMLLEQAKRYLNTDYGRYLEKLVKNNS